MDRKTKKFNTPGGHAIEIYEYMTGYDQREMDRILIGAALDDETAATMSKEKKVELQYAQQDRLFEIMIVSIDGETDKTKFRDLILSWPTPDTNAVIGEINNACMGGDAKKNEK